MKKILLTAIVIFAALNARAQKYSGGLIDKTVAVVGNEMIMLSDIEEEVRMSRLNGAYIDENSRCRILENIMQSKIFLMQARLDSLTVNREMVNAEVTSRMDNARTALGGDEELEKYFRMPVYKLRQEWLSQMEDMSLTQQEQSEVAGKIPEITPFDVKRYMDTVAVDEIPIVPIKYQYSQICIYPNRDSAALACKEKLLDIRQRILNGERFATLARLYSEDPGSSRKGGELGMASKSIFWPAFGDAAMSLKKGMISQIVETPDGFHLIEVLEKKGDMFNARHILLKPKYSDNDRVRAFERLDSLKARILSDKISFDLAARIYSEDPATRTNGGQVADPVSGSAYFDIDQLKPQDYRALQNLEPGQISDPISSLDNEGRDGNEVYKILKLDKIIPSHKATPENDYTELLEGVRNIKRQEAIDDFLDKKIKETYIVIDPLFSDCEFSRKGWLEKITKD
ncbi:MAG: peptidylprolyl isomerase [Bacteroidales bacterium]|nr:peptidylprolyl isomerase [Bacteroidales bacterium]